MAFWMKQAFTSLRKRNVKVILKFYSSFICELLMFPLQDAFFHGLSPKIGFHDLGDKPFSSPSYSLEVGTINSWNCSDNWTIHIEVYYRY